MLIRYRTVSSLFRLIFPTIGNQQIDEFAIGWFPLQAAAGDLAKAVPVTPGPAEVDYGSDVPLHAGWGSVVNESNLGIQDFGYHEKAAGIFQNQFYGCA